MSPELVERVLTAKAVVDDRRSGRCRGSAGYSCRNAAVHGAPACLRHLTREELDAVALARRWAQPLVDRWLFQLPPACWFWPVPDLSTLPFLDDATVPAAWQRDRCAICSVPGRRGGQQGTLVLDHDHVTGLSRGYLCHRCNKRESHSTPVDGRYPNYRRLPPTALLGLNFRYGPAGPQVPAARPAPAAPAHDDVLRRLRQLRKQAEQFQASGSVARDAKGRAYAAEEAEEAWRTLEALLPMLRAAVGAPADSVAGQRLHDLAVWLEQYPPRPPEWA
ncbi:endonuclease domain-containing protein [Streptomyces sp. NPDC088197]|uniref:endonuclease domain-containing protein n=1 Tax=Streptomyces sp. NPDC088197 TaxID=3365840 RepID=UPI003803018F